MTLKRGVTREDNLKRFRRRFLGWQDEKDNKIPLWKEDPELVANMRDWVEQQPDAGEEHFARFCLGDLMDNLYQFQQLLLPVGLLGNTRLEFDLLVLLLCQFWGWVLKLESIEVLPPLSLLQNGT
jgi:hypothetical protein